MTDSTLTAGQRRTALKAALRLVPGIKDIADRLLGKRDLSTMAMSELETLAAKVQVTPGAPRLAIVPTAEPDAPTDDDAPDATAAACEPGDAALDRTVTDIMGGTLADMPGRIRELARQAATPRVVTVEKIVEKIVTMPAPTMAGKAKGTAADVAPVVNAARVQIQPKVIRTASAADVFGVKTDALSRIQVQVMNDPDAPGIDQGFQFDTEILAITLWRMASNAPVMLSGPKGTGKTSFAEQIAARLGRYFALLSFDRTTEIDPLIGQIELAGGATFWRDGALTAAMRRAGSIILFDEPDMAKAGALAGLHPVLANRSVLIPRSGERVTCAPGVYFMAAANTAGFGDDTGVYIDRQQLDGAFRDRFADLLLVPFPPPATEVRILRNRTGITKSAASILVEFANATRTRADKGEQDISAGLGMRRLIAWASGLLSGIAPDTIFKAAVVNHHDREQGEVIWQLYKQTIDAAVLSVALGDVASDTAPDADTGDVL